MYFDRYNIIYLIFCDRGILRMQIIILCMNKYTKNNKKYDFKCFTQVQNSLNNV